jgi:hypothetical protein
MVAQSAAFGQLKVQASDLSPLKGEITPYGAKDRKTREAHEHSGRPAHGAPVFPFAGSENIAKMPSV